MLSYADRYKFYTVYGQYRQLHLIREEGNGKIKDIRCIDTEDLLEGKFEIIEEQEEMDIQDIEELENWFIDDRKEYREFDIQAINLCFKKHQEKINELVQAVKQLDKKIKEK
jgi:hypothetical protein